MERSIGTGSVFKFKLILKGYGYCRLIRFNNPRAENIYLIKVYDHWNYQNEKENIRETVSREYLMNPVIVRQLPKIRGRGAWSLLGNYPMPDDDFIPDFKYAVEMPLADESKIKSWVPVINFTISKDKRCGYEQVRHLEQFCTYAPAGIEMRASMHLLKKENKDMWKYFNLEKKEIADEYYRTMNMPDYSSIPKEIRGKMWIVSPVAGKSVKRPKPAFPALS